MRIGIIGPGNVGSTLGKRFAQQGHSIIYASRNPASPKIAALLKDHPGDARAVPLSEVVSAISDLLVLAIPFGAVSETLGIAQPADGQVLVDTTNPILPNLELAVGCTDSAGEVVARIASSARVVKAFNTCGFQVMADPLFGSQRAFLPVAGDHDDAKQTVMSLAAGIGFEPIDFGLLRNARLMEPLALCWTNLAYAQGLGADMTFSLIRR